MGLNVGLIRESFDAIKPHALEVVEHFYKELFTRYPQARGLFPDRMTKQYKALANGLSHIVEYLEDGAHLKDYLRKMGSRHVDYGTEDEHFDWVGASLLATLEYYFDAQWTDELKENWTAAYTFIATEMKVGMAAERQKTIDINRGSAEPTLVEIAHQVSQEMFRKALNEEFNSPAVQQMIREKAQELLRKAIEIEAKQMLSDARVSPMRNAS